MLKWMRNEAHLWIDDMFNHPLQLQIRLEILNKCEDVNSVNNYGQFSYGKTIWAEENHLKVLQTS